MLKFFEIEARFPRHGGELPPAAVDYVARQVGVDPAALTDYQWSGSTPRCPLLPGRSPIAGNPLSTGRGSRAAATVR